MTLPTCSQHSLLASTLTLLPSSMLGTSAQRRVGVRSTLCIVCSLAEAAPSQLLSASWQRWQREEFGVMPPNACRRRRIAPCCSFLLRCPARGPLDRGPLNGDAERRILGPLVDD